MALTVLRVTAAGHAEDSSAADEETTKLAKEPQNPVANLISVPFQNNFNFNVGTKDVTQWILNVRPVIRVPISDDWNPAPARR